MKICSKCGTKKSLDEFYKSTRRPDGYQASCKRCANAMNTASRASKPELYYQIHKAQREKNRDAYMAWKEQQCCCLCHEATTVCLDLHHLDPNEKDDAISNLMTRWSWERLQTELAKCVVLCRNCHAKVHAGIVDLM